MKAIILAAGYGNRMRPLTDVTHKSLLKVAGSRVIDRMLGGLFENGIRAIVLVTGYRCEELEEHVVAAHPRMQFEFVRNLRFRETNNIYSLALAFEQCNFDAGALLIESDLVYDAPVIRRIIESPHSNVALVDRYRTGMDGTVVTVSGDRIISVIPGHLQGEHFNFSDKYKTLNIYKFSGDFCRAEFRKILTYYAKVIDDNCYYELILGILIYMQQATIHAEFIDGEKWAELDDPNDLRGAEFMFNEDERTNLLAKTQGGYWSLDIVDFCFIRNMYFPTPPMISELRNNLPQLLHNYGSTQVILNEKLAYFLLADPQRVTALNGLSQIYPLLRRWFSGRKGLIPNPTFGEYCGIFSSYDTYADNFGIDHTELTEKISETDVIVVVNPNNPTGSMLEPAVLMEEARRWPQKTFLIDESFIDFSGKTSCEELLRGSPLANVIILKSLSKALGVPGVRIGYALSHDRKFHDGLNAELPIWAMNSIAEHFLEILLKNRRSLAESFVQTRSDREALRQSLAALPGVLRVSESYANYLLVMLEDPTAAAARADQLLRDHKIYAKDCSGKFADGRGYLRFAVRGRKDNALLLRALA